MSRHDSAPTHGWVITSWINKWVVRLCLLIATCGLVAGATLVMRLNADCRDVAKYDLTMFGYEAHLAFNKAVGSCG